MSSTQPATEEERQKAAQAQQHFEACRYKEAADLLGKLSTSRGQDPKILHNKALVEYCKSGFKRTDEFCKALRECCAKVQLNLDQVDHLDDADQCIFFYNHAIILYHLRQYRKALAILQKLSQFIEPIAKNSKQKKMREDGLSRKILLLLIELHIQTHQPKDALMMINYLEKNLLPKSSSDGSSGGQPGDDVLRSTIIQYRARSFIAWKSLKNCKREMKALTASNNAMTAPLIYLKANHECLRGNYRKAIKVLNSTPSPKEAPSVSGVNLAMMHYNNLGVIHFMMRKHHMGARYFKQAIDENSDCVQDLCKLTLGRSMNGVSLQYLSVSRHYELLYNMGIQQLHCSNPETAFDCLIEVAQRYQSNPRLWLRLAECCIMAHKANNDEDRQLASKLAVLQGSQGSGLHRKIILGSGVNKSAGEREESAALPSTTLEFASLCVKNALMLLPEDSTASATSSGISAGSTDGSEGESRSSDAVLVPAPPGHPLKGGEVDNLRCCVLAAGAYVSLCLNDYVLAMNYAKRLLNEPRLTNAHQYLGQMYMAEAQVAMDHIADAVEHLDPSTVTDISVLFPEQQRTAAQSETGGDRNGDSEQDGGKGGGWLYPWTPQTTVLARAIMQYNLAVAHAVRGEFSKALQHCNQCCQHIEQPYPAQVHFLRLYLELIDGRRHNAVNIIQENFGHVGPTRQSP